MQSRFIMLRLFFPFIIFVYHDRYFAHYFLRHLCGLKFVVMFQSFINRYYAVKYSFLLNIFTNQCHKFKTVSDIFKQNSLFNDATKVYIIYLLYGLMVK